MHHINIHRRIGLLLLLCMLCPAWQRVVAQCTKPSIDFFSGIDFNFRDINYERQYDLLIRLTPGFRWNMGNHWQMTGQVVVPLVNQYGDQYDYVYPTNLAISKEMKLGPLYLKGTAGLFSHHYGLDLKAFLPLCEWFALEAQADYLGIIFTIPQFVATAPEYFAGTIGGDIYLKRWNTQLRGTIGRYTLLHDYGFQGEIMRHFNHSTVSVYANWSSWDMYTGTLLDCMDAGFKFIVMLPPYHRKCRTVNFRPASNFSMIYTVMYHTQTNRMIITDPEENERDGWFSRDFLEWGSHTMEPDFIIDNGVPAETNERKEAEE